MQTGGCAQAWNEKGSMFEVRSFSEGVTEEQVATCADPLATGLTGFFLWGASWFNFGTQTYLGFVWFEVRNSKVWSNTTLGPPIAVAEVDILFDL